MITGTLYLSSSESESSNSVKMPLDLMSGSKSAIELVTIVHREGMYMYGAMAKLPIVSQVSSVSLLMCDSGEAKVLAKDQS